ncbi:MAG: DUF4190 domain-containing protein [Acidimicrobiales bacterium]
MTIEDQGGALGASSGCRACGRQVSPGRANCQGCGTPVASEARASGEAAPTPDPTTPPASSFPLPPPPPPGAGNPNPGYPPPYQAPYPPPYQLPYPPPYQLPYQAGYQGYYGPVAVGRRTNGMAIASMVLGILWLWWIGSILALVFGYVALGQIKQRNEGGRGMAIAGVVLGWVGIVTGVLFGILIAFAASHTNSGSFGP